MKNISRLLAAGLLAAVMTLSTQAAQWLTDANAAQAQAKREKKMVLLDFTGSDWCSWCIKFDSEVFDTKAFNSYASTNLVLVKVDFPKKKHLAPQQQAANEILQSKFNVDGFPTLIVLNGSGKEVGRQTGYKPGGPAAFTAWLDKLKAK